MKKIISILVLLSMVMTLVLGMVSCSDKQGEECGEHSDGNGDGVCDVCGKECKIPDDDKNPDDGKKPETDDKNDGELSDEKRKALADIIISQLEIAASLKIDFTLSRIDSVSGEGENSYLEVLENYKVTVSKGNDTLDLSVYATVKEKKASEADFKVRFDGQLMYLVDNVLYTRDMDREFYYQKDVDLLSVDELIDAVRSVLGDASAPTTAEIEEIKDSLEKIFLETFNRNGNIATLVINAKEPLNKIAEYLAGIDMETKTVESFINDILSSVLEEVTASDITEKLYELLPLTVDEALSRFDSWITKEEGMTAQQFYDKFIGGEDSLTVIENSLRLNGVSEDEIKTVIDKLTGLNIEEYIRENDIGDTALIVLLNEMISEISAKEEAAPAIESEAEPDAEKMLSDFKESLNAMLSMTLSEITSLYMSPEEILRLERIKTLISGTAVDSAELDVKINFIDGYNVSYIDLEGGYDIAMEIPETDGEGNEKLLSLNQKADVSVKIYDLSLNSVTIVPDEEFIVIPK